MRKRIFTAFALMSRPGIVVISTIYRIYVANRLRIEQLKENRKVSRFIRLGAISVLIIWVLIWYFAPDQAPVELIDDIKQSIGSQQ